MLLLVFQSRLEAECIPAIGILCVILCFNVFTPQQILWVQNVCVYRAELAPECASAYYRYGSVLLYQAQESADVFGAPLPEENDDKENEEEETFGKDNDNDKDENAMDKGKGPKLFDGSEGRVGNFVCPPADDQGGQELEGGDLQLAWENLEIARTIWSKDAAANAKELSDVSMLLGDVSMENEDFEVALNEFDAALEHLGNVKDILPSDRRWAEVHFKRCYALQYMNRNAEALVAVKSAMEVLQLRKSSLDSEKDEKEAADVDAVLEDLKEKVEELELAVKEEQSMKDTMKSMLEQMKSGANQQQHERIPEHPNNRANAPKAASTTPVKDLGVVGRGTKRITLAPVATGEAENDRLEKKPRSLEDAMSAPSGFVQPAEDMSSGRLPDFLKTFTSEKETKAENTGADKLEA
jgi:HAT1-interacting factor 1